MSARRHLLRRGRYSDSLVLMQLQRALDELPGVEESAAMMATAANREILEERELWPSAAADARPEDLLVVVRASDEAAAAAALGEVDGLLARRAEESPVEYRYRSLTAALDDNPQATWVAISVPGEHAAAVAEEALAAGRHVFLYSDNVAVEREVALKRMAAHRGRLMLGPDCGTARIGGVGLGFANRVRRGGIGLVGASGTGLQAVSCGIDALAAAESGQQRKPLGDGRIGVSQIVGTGGRDLSARVGGMATLQALDLLGRDEETEVVVLVSKPPAPAVAARVVERAGQLGKPVVVCLLGKGSGKESGKVGGEEDGGEDGAATVFQVAGLEAAAERAVSLLVPGRRPGGGSLAPTPATGTAPVAGAPEPDFGPSRAARYLRGLFCGGTLALEAAVALRGLLAPLSTNLGLPGTLPLADPERSAGHTVVDLGADELTRGRPHPMIDPAARDGRLRREAADPETAVLLVDVVLGDGAHPDPAAGLAVAIESALAAAGAEGRSLTVVALVVGCIDDPQGLDRQIERLRQAGARVTRSLAAAVGYAAEAITQRADAGNGSGKPASPTPQAAAPSATVGAAAGADVATEETAPAAQAGQQVAAQSAEPGDRRTPVPLSALEPPAVINVGPDHFAGSVAAQGAAVVQVDWRPPAGGDARLASILERMKTR